MCMMGGGGGQQQQVAAQPLTAEQRAARNAQAIKVQEAASLQRKTKEGPEGGLDFAETREEFRARRKKLFGIGFKSAASEGGAAGGAGGSGSSGCFVAGSLIAMADGSTKPIELIEVGDRVASFEDLSGPITEGTVCEVAVDYVDVVVINGTLGVSHSQLMVTGDGNWQSVSDLVVGDTLLADTGDVVTINSIDHLPQKAFVFNFDVKDTATYMVGGYRTVRGIRALGYKLMEASPYPTMQIALSNFVKDHDIPQRQQL